MCMHAHMLAAISWINTYMFHPPHEEWNICIYMVAATSHMYACVHSSIPQSWNMVKCIEMIHDKYVTRCTRCACDSMRVQNIHA